MATTAARATADESRAGRNPPQPSIPGSMEVVDASSGFAGSSRTTLTAAAETTPSSHTNVGMSDGADIGGRSVASGGKGAIVGGPSGIDLGNADSASSVAPAASNTGAMAMDVDEPRPPHQAAGLPLSGVGEDGSSNLVINIPGDSPVADAVAPHAAQDGVSGSLNGGTERGEGAVLAKSTASAAAGGEHAANPPSAAPQSTSASKESGGASGRSGSSCSSSGGGHDSGSGDLGKGRCPTMYTDLTIETDGSVLVEKDGSETLKRRREDEPAEPPGKGAEKPPPVQVLGLRGVPGPDLGPFFQGTALPARKDGGGKNGRDVGKLAAITEGLRRMGTLGARTATEASAAEAMAIRISDGNATQEV